MGIFDRKIYKMLSAQVPVFIDTSSPLSIGVQMAARATAPTDQNCTANRAIYIPFILPGPTTVVKLWCFNGSVVSGNIDVGIYDDAGSRKVSSGSTAQAGTTSLQAFDVTDTYLSAGRYYLAFALSNATGKLYRWNIDGRVVALLYEDAAFPLPATATWLVGTDMPPLIGLSTRVLV